MSKRVAVVLSGCGFQDGSEIREAVGTLWALSQEGAEVDCFAPNQNQSSVVNHMTGKPLSGQIRNVLDESARIARGQIKPLTELNPNNYDAMILPGGFGAATNLSSFGTQGSGGNVNPLLQKAIESFHSNHKPLGAVCIAPAVLALALKGKGLHLTVGQPCEASQEIEKLGHTHETCPANNCVVDPKNQVVTTPAYMYDDGKLHEIFEGIHKLTQAVLTLPST